MISRTRSMRPVPILEADEVRAGLCQTLQRLGRDNRVVAVVDDHTKTGGIAHRLDVLEQTFLRRVDQIMWKQQQPVRTRLFSAACDLLGRLRAISATRNDRHVVGRGFRGPHCLDHLGGRHGEELARATGCKKCSGIVLAQPIDMPGIAVEIERVVRIEMRDRKRK